MTATPLGVPVEPDVKMIHASSRGSGAPACQPRDEPGPSCHAGFAEHRDDVGFAEYQFGALVGVVGVDGNVGRADGQRRQDRLIQRKAARRHPDADPVAATDAPGGQPRDARFDIADQLAVGELHCAVVDRRGVGVARGGVVEDVDSVRGLAA